MRQGSLHPIHTQPTPKMLLPRKLGRGSNTSRVKRFPPSTTMGGGRDDWKATWYATVKIKHSWFKHLAGWQMHVFHYHYLKEMWYSELQTASEWQQRLLFTSSVTATITNQKFAVKLEGTGEDKVGFNTHTSMGSKMTILWNALLCNLLPLQEK